MIRTRALTTVAAIVAGATFITVASLSTKKSASAASPAEGATFDQHAVWAAWKLYCDPCHTGPRPKGNVNLESLDLASLDKNGEVWEKVLRKVRSREMP